MLQSSMKSKMLQGQIEKDTGILHWATGNG